MHCIYMHVFQRIFSFCNQKRKTKEYLFCSKFSLFFFSPSLRLFLLFLSLTNMKTFEYLKSTTTTKFIIQRKKKEKFIIQRVAYFAFKCIVETKRNAFYSLIIMEFLFLARNYFTFVSSIQSVWIVIT